MPSPKVGEGRTGDPPSMTAAGMEHPLFFLSRLDRNLARNCSLCTFTSLLPSSRTLFGDDGHRISVTPLALPKSLSSSSSGKTPADTSIPCPSSLAPALNIAPSTPNPSSTPQLCARLFFLSLGLDRKSPVETSLSTSLSPPSSSPSFLRFLFLSLPCWPTEEAPPLRKVLNARTTLRPCRNSRRHFDETTPPTRVSMQAWKGLSSCLFSPPSATGGRKDDLPALSPLYCST
mmetsp:Transcript_30121/g.77684  ORF Transcript_30121/g.77684 Transcript_30121/m.77684 type:complete len:232 (+) Transcript_30121:302-997(+)